MRLVRQARLYFHTLRYLKPVQIWGRILFRFVRLKPNQRSTPSLRPVEGGWSSPAPRRSSMLSPTRFRFLNVESNVTHASDWNHELISKLWLYNLHYFDDLNSEGALKRKEWHRALISRWIDENPPGRGTGWEPYPLSLRIINWIKWALKVNKLDEAARHSLAVQVRFLTQRLERHILGNHLFVNAKALVFAGCYFDGDEARSWMTQGMSVLEREMPEQVLKDGGQFERSPMYHALAYEDMLDLLNLARAYPAAFETWSKSIEPWMAVTKNMGHWLRTMCHPDGEIAFFNDAAIGISPRPDSLFAYAERLGLPPVVECKVIDHLNVSGYVRVSLGPAVLLIDTAMIGPEYLPAHAHADTLSYELSLYGQRIVVNSGTSRYGQGSDREWERSTAAHSTVEIDGQNSSEVWAGFRVARRAYPFDVSIKREGDAMIVEASHDGYRRLPGRPIHRRQWRLEGCRLEVSDFIEGEFTEAVSRVYFHPDVKVKKNDAGGMASWSDHHIHWETSALDSGIGSSYWHPEFGLNFANKFISMKILPLGKSAYCRFLLDWT